MTHCVRVRVFVCLFTCVHIKYYVTMCVYVHLYVCKYVCVCSTFSLIFFLLLSSRFLPSAVLDKLQIHSPVLPLTALYSKEKEERKLSEIELHWREG